MRTHYRLLITLLKKRVTLIKETAADLGLNAVIGLQYDIKLGPFDERVGPGRSNAILANIGSARQQNPEDLPKFIVCLPALNFIMIEKGRVEDLLNRYLREHILYSFGYQKGYYVYNRDALRVDRASILNGSISLEALGEPIGIPPDFVLLCDVRGYDAYLINTGKMVLITLRLTMTLYDLKEKKVVWTGTAEGTQGKRVTDKFIVGYESPFLAPQTLGAALMKAVDTMPSVKGFRKGPASQH